MSLDLSMTELELAMRKLANTVKLDTIEACAKISENYLLDEKVGGAEFVARNEIARQIRALATRSPQESCDHD
jgi:hypothetical protein